MEQSISLIIPCYNEEPEVLYKTISDLYTSLINHVTNFEIIVVNDGSDKFEYDVSSYPKTEILYHKKNKGYGASLKTGIKHAAFEWIGITDADGTYPNDKFHKLMPYTHNNDMVVGTRDWKDISLIRKFPKMTLTKFACFLSSSEIPDLNSGMRVFKKELSYMFWYLLPDKFSFTSTITMCALTNDIDVKFYDIKYYQRIGKSSISPIRDTALFFTLVLRLSLYFNPKRFFLPLSIIFLTFAVLRSIRDYIVTGSFGGLTLILFFITIQVFFFGLIAEIINKTRKFLYKTDI